jgi:hypothetical protein
MDSITLKTEPNKVVMYGFDTRQSFKEGSIDAYLEAEYNHIWSGHKSHILQHDDDFWKDLVESEPHPLWKDMGVIQFKNYINEFENFNTAKESGLSAIEKLTESNYILIVETKG